MNRTHVGEPILRSIHTPPTDQDDGRRRKPLSILLAGLAVLSILTLLETLAANLSAAEHLGELYATAVAVPVDAIVIWTISRYGPTWVASISFCCRPPPWPLPIRWKRSPARPGRSSSSSPS